VSVVTQGVPCRTALSPKGFYFKSADTSDVNLRGEAAQSYTRILQRPDRAFTWFTVSPDGGWQSTSMAGRAVT